MIILNYCKEGIALSDFDMEQTYQQIKEAGGEYNFSTSPIFFRFKQAVAEEEIEIDDIEFRLNGVSVQMNQYGAIPNWPKGFLQGLVDIAQRTLEAQMRRHKERLDKKEALWAQKRKLY